MPILVQQPSQCEFALTRCPNLCKQGEALACLALYEAEIAGEAATALERFRAALALDPRQADSGLFSI